MNEAQRRAAVRILRPCRRIRGNLAAESWIQHQPLGLGLASARGAPASA